MKFEDDRVPKEVGFNDAVAAKDRCMSGWGMAKGGTSWVAWAFDPEEVDGEKLLAWVEGRSEMRLVERVDLDRWVPPKTCAHFRVYVATKGHPSQK